MYAGKAKADKAYGQVLGGSNMGGVYGSANRLKAQKAAKAVDVAGNPIQNAAENAAVAQVESDLQDELAADNRMQSDRTFSFAQRMAEKPRIPGGSIQRGGSTTIGAATGGGLARANAEAKRAKRIAAAKATAGASEAVLASNAAKNLGLSSDLATLYGLGRA